MADSKITDFAALTGLADGDQLLVVDVSDTSMAATGTDKKVAFSELKTGLALTTVATDVLYDAKGDVPVGTGANASAKLTVGTFGQVAKADSTTSTGLIYGAAPNLAEHYLKPTGSYETFSRSQGMNNAGTGATGTVSLYAVVLPKNYLVTSIATVSGLTAAVSPTNWWFSLCDSAYTTLRSTADQLTGAIAANTPISLNLSSTFTTAYEGLYYIAVMVKASTMPSWLGCNTMPNAAGYTVSPIIALNGITGQTTAPADATNLATSPAAKLINIWAYVI